MKCLKCGYENEENVLYCNLCGYVFRKEEKKEISGSDKNVLVIKQQKEIFEAVTDFETKNKYTIYTKDGQLLFYVREESSTFFRWFFPTRRPFNIIVMYTNGALYMQLRRDFFLFFSHLDVYKSARRIGEIRRRFAILGRKFEIIDPLGQKIAEIRGHIFRPWTFYVKKGEYEIARITKKWSGLLKEYFTDADNFVVEYKDPSLREDVKDLILAAAFSIDFDFFEKAGSVSIVFDLFESE